MDERLLWIWLSLRISAGSKTGERLLEHFGSIEAIYRAERKELIKCGSLGYRLLNALSDKEMTEAESILAWCEKYKVMVITKGSDLYPQPLTTLQNPPVVLYALGKMPAFDTDLFVAVVGTRSMSEYGRTAAYEMGKGLASGGACVVSGLARGIDSTAQLGCLDAGGVTVAVLGCGINVVYPKENRPLMKRIVESGGLILTEYPPNTPPNGANFPVRNRLICGLCQGTVVVEADKRSGALITAREAISQGRDIYAVPGRIHTAGSSGTNKLIKDGAKIALSAFDVLEDYCFLYPHCVNLNGARQEPSPAEKTIGVSSIPDQLFDRRLEKRRAENRKNGKAGTVCDKDDKKIETTADDIDGTEEESCLEITPSFDISVFSETELRVYYAMPVNKPISPDELTECGLSTKEICGAFTFLEVYGAVEASPGGFYIRKI